MTEKNPMRDVRIEKLTLNIGAGKEQTRLEKGIALLNYIGNAVPVKTVTKKRIQEWGLRPGLPIGCKLTLRRKRAKELLVRLLDAKDHRIDPLQFDDNGNIAFGIHEYIDVPGVNYDPKIGIMGFQVCVTLERPGFRIKRRTLLRRSIPLRHKITKEEAIEFMRSAFNVKVEEEQ